MLTKFLRKLSTFPARSFLFEIPPIRARKSSDHVSNSRATVRRKKRIVPVGASFKVRRTADLKVVCPVHTQSSKFNYPNSRVALKSVDERETTSSRFRVARPLVSALGHLDRPPRYTYSGILPNGRKRRVGNSLRNRPCVGLYIAEADIMVHMWVNTVTGCGLPRKEINGLRFGPLVDRRSVRRSRVVVLVYVRSRFHRACIYPCVW